MIYEKSVKDLNVSFIFFIVTNWITKIRGKGMQKKIVQKDGVTFQ